MEGFPDEGGMLDVRMVERCTYYCFACVWKSGSVGPGLGFLVFFVRGWVGPGPKFGPAESLGATLGRRGILKVQCLDAHRDPPDRSTSESLISNPPLSICKRFSH